MATHAPENGGDAGAELPDVVPFSLPYLSRLSWELGSRVVDDDESTRHSEWERTGSSWTLTVFRVTDNTVLLKIRTPVGRERFYGAARSDLQTVLPRLEETPYWDRRE
ncbi:hypothetical protein ACFO5R_15820 [Halosolutus amylolyticus]|uniref:Uncharacterized protein n=1 Tax=Halosolutus amylolyticus TaxID=2932267 RepID=A0ABD5PSH7_9EURY|nr:hypothetical protein [Halosolutus amylolyticus]